MNLSKWFKFKWGFSDPPEILDVGGPYLIRWDFLKLFGISFRFHTFLKSDPDRGLHDHPWWMVSILLAGGYCEELRGTGLISRLPIYRIIKRKAPSIAFRHATDAHRVTLIDGKPCLTLIITGPKKRDWGFYRKEGWVKWTPELGEFDSRQEAANIRYRSAL